MTQPTSVQQANPTPAKSKGGRIIELDFVRGIAILMVISFHANDDWAKYLGVRDIGWAGVNLFFVLSGYLVGGLLIKEWRTTGKVNGVRFLKRRAFKIWPAYYFYVFIAIIFHTHPYDEFVVGNLLNIQNYTGTALGHTWSLAVEEHFYLLLTGFFVLAGWMVFSIRQVIFILAFVALSVTVARDTTFYFNGEAHRQIIYTHFQMDALLLGVLLTITQQVWPNVFAAILAKRLLLWTLFLAIFILLLKRDLVKSLDYIGITVVDICCALFLLLMLPRGTERQHGGLYRLVAWIGVYSYSTYLWHLAPGKTLVWISHHLSPPVAAVFLSILPFPAAILLGWIMTKLVEFPFLRLREKLIPSPIESHLTPASAHADDPPTSAPVDGKKDRDDRPVSTR